MIYGDGIRFRAIEREDLSTFVEWFNEPELREGIMLYLPMSLAHEEKWFEEMLKRTPDEQPMAIEAAQDKNWSMVGNCGFFNIERINRSSEIGIVIAKPYWEKGYGTKAMKLILEHGFNTLNLNRISLGVYSSNPRAKHVYEKVGFVEEGRLRQAHYHNGDYVDEYIMSVLREEWNSDS